MNFFTPKAKNCFYAIILLISFFGNFNEKLFSQTVETPIIDYVTVDHISHKPVIVWNISDPALIDGFSLKRLIYSHPLAVPMSIQTIDTIYDPFLTTYQDFTTVFGPALPYERTEQYGIVAINIIGTDTFFSLVSDYHKTMYLETEYSYCDHQNDLSWNRYQGWGNNFLRYDIYGREGTQPFVKLGEITQNDQTEFSHEGISYNSDYEYYIIAVRNDGTESFSNISNVYTQTIIFPSFLAADSVIVNEENEINLYFTTDINADIEDYSLYKSDIRSGVYHQVKMINHDQSKIVITDPVFDYQKVSYFYLSANNYCGNSIFYSDTVNNIVLEAEKSEYAYLINWEDENTGKNYTLERCIEDDCNEIYSDVGFQYSDQKEQILYGQYYSKTTPGLICYQIEGTEAGFVSISNITCITEEEKYYLPNAFNPESNISENRIFKPIIAFISEYEMIIYGPSGNIIFQTKDPDRGWDGTLKDGKLAPRATYLYFISFRNSEGKRIRKKAYVTLVY